MTQRTTIDSISQSLTALGYTSIPLRQNIAGQILIDARINGVEGAYILDSGAGQTVVDSKQLDYLKLKLNYDEAVDTGGGMGAHSMENVPSYNNTIEMGDFRLDDLVVAVMSLESAWESLAHVGAHDVLFGILGVDVLKAGHALLDFSTLTLYLKHT